MSDMIQINIQAILDSKSKESILNSINSIRDEINGSPIKLKIETDSDTLNSLASKIQTLTSEANTPIKINVDSSAMNKVSDTFKVFTIADQEVKKLIDSTKQYTNELGQTVTVVQKYKQMMNDAGTGIDTAKELPIERVSSDYEKARLEAEKLIITQDKLRASIANMGSTPQAINAENLISGLNPNSSLIDQREAKLAVDEVTNAYKQQVIAENDAQKQAEILAATTEKQTLAIQSQQEKYNLLFAEIRGGASSVKLTEEQMVLLQEKLSAISVGPEAFNQLDSLKSLMASMRSETNIKFVADSEIENTRLENIELQKQVALFQERNQLALRSIQSQFPSLSKTPDVQSQISSITASSSSLTNVADMEAFKAESAQVTSATNNMRAGLNEAKVAAQGFGADILGDSIKMLEWTVVGGALFGSLSLIKKGLEDVISMNSTLGTLSITMNTTSQGLQNLSKQIQEVAISTGSSTQAVADSVKIYANYGESVVSIMAKTKSAIQLSNVTGLDTKEVTDSIHAILNEYNMGTQNIEADSQHIADSLVAISKNMAMDFGQGVSEITKGIQVTGEVANQVAKQTSDQTEAMLGGIVEKLRISGEQAGNGIKTIISRIYQSKTIDPNVTDEDLSKTSAMLSQLGVSVMDATGKYRNLSDIFSDINKAEQNMTDSQKEAISLQGAGVRQANIFATAIDTVGRAQTLTNAAMSSSGELYNANAKYMETTAAKLQVLKSTITNIWLNTIDSSLINGLVSSVTSLVTNFGNLRTVLALVATGLAIFKGNEILKFFETLPTTIKTSIMNLQLFKDISVANTMVASGEATAMEGLSLSFQSLGMSIKSLFLSNPLGWIALGVTAVVMAMDSYSQSQTEATQKQKDSISAYQEQQTSINTLIQSYKDNAELAKTDDSAKTKLIDTETKLKNAFGDSAKSLDLQGGSIDANIKKLAELDIANQNSFIAKQKAYADEAKNALSSSNQYNATPTTGTAFSGNVFSGTLEEAIKHYSELRDEVNKDLHGPQLNGGDTILQSKQLSDEIDKLKIQLSGYKSSISSLDGAYKAVAQDSITGLDKLSTAQKTVFDQMKNGLTFTNAGQYKKNLQSVADILSKWDGKNIDDLNNKLHKVDSTLPAIAKDATTATGSVDTLARSLSSVITATKASQDNIKSYNQILYDQANGTKMSTEKAVELIGANEKMAGAIKIVSGAVVINTDMIKALRQAEIDAIATKITGSSKSIDAQINETQAVITATKARIKSMEIETAAVSKLDAAKQQAKFNETGHIANSPNLYLSTPADDAALAKAQADLELLKNLKTLSSAISSSDYGVSSASENAQAAKDKAAAAKQAAADKKAKAAQVKADKAKAAADKKAAADAQKHANAVAVAEEKVAVATKRVNDAKTVSQKESALDALNVANANLDAVNKAGATAESIAQARTAAITSDSATVSANAIAQIANVQKTASDLIIAGYQKQIDAINTKTATETRTTQQLQYQNDLIKQQNDLTNAQNEKNVRVYQDGKWQWEADQTAVQTARDAVSTTQTASAKFKSDNANTDKIAVLNTAIKTEQDKQAAREKAASASVKGYATGTDNAEAGVKDINENGIEIIAGNKANFQGGEQVINANDTSRILNGDTRASLNTVGQSVSANDNLVKRPLDVLLSDINDNIQKFIDASPKYAHDIDNNIGKSITNNDILIKRPLNVLVQDISNSLQHFVDMSPQYGKDMDKNMGDSVIANNALLVTPVTVLIDKVKTGINAFVMDSYNSGTGMIDELGKGVTDSTASITDIVKTLTDKVVGQFHTSFGIHSPSTVMHKIGEFLMQGLANGISSNDINSFIQSQFTDMAASGQSVVGGAVSGNVQDWIAAAIKATGIDGSNATALEQIAMNESSGDPNAINRWDSNAKAGHPSQGLMQMIPSTFNEYKMSGHDDILNPIDSAIASIKYMISRYGSISNVPGIKSMNSGGGYVGYQDGIESVPKDGVYRVNEDNKSEIVTLPQGAGVIKNSLTKNLMDWGKFNPNNFLKNILPKLNLPEFKINTQNQGSQAPITNITVQHVELPNVSDSEGFINSLIQLSDTTA